MLKCLFFTIVQYNIICRSQESEHFFLQKIDNLGGGSKATHISLDFSRIIVGDIIVGWNHDITISGRESVSIGIVQVAASSCISSWVVSKLGNNAWRRISWIPTRLQGCSSRVGGISIDRVSINVITNLGIGAGCSGIGDAARNL